MNNYIFITAEGYEVAPNGEDINNLQVLGFAEGATADDAMCNLFTANPWIIETGYDTNELKGIQIVNC